MSAPPLHLWALTGDPRLPDPTKRGGRYNEEDADTHRAMVAALESLPGLTVTAVDDHAALLTRLEREPPDMVLNFCDTGFRNVPTQELHVAALLDMLDVPYSGAAPACMALCFDKAIVRLVAEGLGVPVPRETFIHPELDAASLPDAYPAILKPNQGDGSVGITKDAVVRAPDEAAAYLESLRRLLPGRAALMQDYLPGPEYGLGVIGNPGAFTVLPPLRVDFSRLPEGLPPILSFESKALPDSPYWTDIVYRQAELDERRLAAMTAQATALFERLGCRDYARFDFRADYDGVPRLLEVNPNPAWAYDGKLALMAGFAGHGYAEMLAMIVGAARRRLGL